MKGAAEVRAFVADLEVDVEPGSELERRTVEAWLWQSVPGSCRCGARLRRFEKLNGGECWACSQAAAAEGEGPGAALERRLAGCGVPARYRGYSLEAWVGPIPPALLEWVADPSGVLYLAGPVGTGKSHLAVVALAMLEASGAWCLWQSCRSLPRELAEDERVDGRPLWRRLSKVTALVLDDLGAEPGVAWAADRVGAVLDERYQSGLASIVTSNLSLSELYAADPRIGSRLSAGAVVVNLTGPDRRVVPIAAERGSRAPR